MPAAPRIRPAARAVVTDPARRILLVHFDFPVDDGLPAGLWACPGGGVEPGEETVHALLRELREELGLAITDPGRPVWHKEHVFPMTRWDGQQDTYFWLEVEPFEPHPHLTEQQLRDEHVDGMRWWDYDELQAAQRAYDAGDPSDPSFAVLSPRPLGHLLADLFTHGRPSQTRELEPL